MGHGALVFDPAPMPPSDDEPIFVSVTGPRRSLMRASKHKPYFAVPYGDMMIAGCFGLLRAFADVYPEHAETILSSLNGVPRGAPWDSL